MIISVQGGAALFAAAAYVHALQQPPASQPEDDRESIVIGYDGIGDKGEVEHPWVIKDREGTPQFKVVKVENVGTTLYMKSDRASFSFEREVVIPTTEYRSVRWRWYAETLPPNGDVRKTKWRRNKNDQALQVFVFFENATAISYIWDSNAPVGTTTDESYWGVDVKTLVLNSGGSQIKTWIDIDRDIAEDYRQLFKAAVPKSIVKVRLQTNSQHTKAIGAGYVTELNFVPRQADEPDPRESNEPTSER